MGQGSGTLAEESHGSHFWAILDFQRSLASLSCSEGGQIWYPEKEGTIGLQKSIGSTESETGPGPGTLDDDTTRAISEVPPSKWNNSGTSWRR